jgi:putative alpha-1,2-mannosidase
MNNGIKAAFTTTERCGLHQYSFPKSADPVIRFNLGFAINWDSPTETFIEKLDDSTIVGYRYSKGWASMQRVYFAARTNIPFSKLYLANGKESLTGNSAKGKWIKGQLLFKNSQGKFILMKVALSSVSTCKGVGCAKRNQGLEL